MQAQGDGGFSERTATGFALLPAPIQKVLGCAGVEQLVGRDAGEHHEFLGGECGKPLKQRSENGREEIRVALQNLLGAALAASTG